MRSTVQHNSIMSNNIIPADLTTVAEIAKLLQTSTASVRRWVRVGLIPGFQLGGQLRISKADALAFLTRVVPDNERPHIPTRAEYLAAQAADDAILRLAGIKK